MGVSEDSKGWLFWVPEKKTIVKSASVVFDENSHYINGKICNANVNLIQIHNLFDKLMVDELKKQDESTLQLSEWNGLEILIPSTYCEAMNSEEKTNWTKAIHEEIESMQLDEHEVVFTKKPKRFKVRLVATGFCQIHGINHDETFAPTPTFNSLHLLFSTACSNNWKVRTFDVKVAFLHSLIDKLVYVWPPMGINVPKYKVLKLKKALYGTKQASRCWWMHLRGILHKIGFKSNGEDPSSYTLHQGEEQAILWVHMNDRALTALLGELLDQISHQLSGYLKMKWDEKINGLVGILITKTDQGFEFWQPDLTDKLTNLTPIKILAKNPLPMNCQLESNLSSNAMDKPYLRRIVILLYIAQASCPDIAYAVNYLAQFSLNTDQLHWAALNHLTAYLHGTRDMRPTLGKQTNLRNSTTIASSTAQAEYMALSFAVKETLWLHNLLFDILRNPAPTLFSDNKTAVGISTESMNRKQTWHLIRGFNTINEYIAMGNLCLQWVLTDEQLGDVMTKPLGRMKHGKFVMQINAF
ncbi:hypothetical protein O181_053558 [Austropuccinia psidii MF-1]|uniref:Reverse transcriptase Ty1/copia-type domain-containing protein n=1 Tax=Austropuccinia psidii MF-1 TaxID=1389203 RepID=A0A9Q3E4K5_9BASI|nr:hypothetical protein [Austropuccinia psidii MF-1]